MFNTDFTFVTPETMDLGAIKDFGRASDLDENPVFANILLEAEVGGYGLDYWTSRSFFAINNVSAPEAMVAFTFSDQGLRTMDVVAGVHRDHRGKGLGMSALRFAASAADDEESPIALSRPITLGYDTEDVELRNKLFSLGWVVNDRFMDSPYRLVTPDGGPNNGVILVPELFAEAVTMRRLQLSDEQRRAHLKRLHTASVAASIEKGKEVDRYDKQQLAEYQISREQALDLLPPAIRRETQEHLVAISLNPRWGSHLNRALIRIALGWYEEHDQELVQLLSRERVFGFNKDGFGFNNSSNLFTAAGIVRLSAWDNGRGQFRELEKFIKHFSNGFVW